MQLHRRVCVVSLCFYSPARCQLLKYNTKLFKELLSLRSLSLGFFVVFFPSVQSGIGKTITTESSAKRGRNIKGKNRATVNSAARLTSASPFARSSSNHKKVPKISPKRQRHNFQTENLFFFSHVIQLLNPWPLTSSFFFPTGKNLNHICETTSLSHHFTHFLHTLKHPKSSLE